MKKLLALLLALVMVFSMTACGGSQAPAPKNDAKVDGLIQQIKGRLAIGRGYNFHTAPGKAFFHQFQKFHFVVHKQCAHGGLLHMAACPIGAA